MRISDWSSDVCSSDLRYGFRAGNGGAMRNGGWGGIRTHGELAPTPVFKTGALNRSATHPLRASRSWRGVISYRRYPQRKRAKRSEEHTSELQSLMRISYAVFCLKKKY